MYQATATHQPTGTIVAQAAAESYIAAISHAVSTAPANIVYGLIIDVAGPDGEKRVFVVDSRLLIDLGLSPFFFD